MAEQDLVKQKISGLAAKIDEIVQSSSLEQAVQLSITSWLESVVLALSTQMKIQELEIVEPQSAE